MLGDLYYFDLKETEKAIPIYEKGLSFNPEGKLLKNSLKIFRLNLLQHRKGNKRNSG